MAGRPGVQAAAQDGSGVREGGLVPGMDISIYEMSNALGSEFPKTFACLSASLISVLPYVASLPLASGPHRP